MSSTSQIGNVPMKAATAAATRLSQKATKLHKQVSRLSSSAVQQLFPESQRNQWPSGYIPASGVAHFLQPGGVPFQDLLDCAEDLKGDREAQRALQRDFAADYTLWSRCTLEDALRTLDTRARRKFKKITARDRCSVHDEEVRAFFALAPYAPAPPASMGVPADPTRQQHLKGGLKHGSMTGGAKGKVRELRLSPQERERYYEFTPYAATQEYAMMPVAGIQSPGKKVSFTTFPQVRNVLYRDFDCTSTLRALSLFSGDDLVYTTELVQNLALYLNRRLHELLEHEDSFIASADQASDQDIRFSRASPILCCFGNGRLAWSINETGLLPTPVHPMQLPSQESRRARRHAYLMSQQQKNYLFSSYDFSESFTHLFPCETSSVGDALRKYKPAIVVVEPHSDRDLLSDIRGFHSVREVVVLGPIDSPAMASFAFPFLSFGVTPGPTTYWAYNANLQRVTASERIQLPVDPPHELQGYVRAYQDDVSAYLISPNDCTAIGRQYRCLSFLRTQCPVVKQHENARRGGGVGVASKPSDAQLPSRAQPFGKKEHQ